MGNGRNFVLMRTLLVTGFRDMMAAEKRFMHGQEWGSDGTENRSSRYE